MEDFILIKGKTPGPKSMILVGVHGNELCGIEAIKKLLPLLKIEKGTVYIGYGNPRAIEKGVRFTEENLNRMFISKPTPKQRNSYEYKRAKYLKKYMKNVDVLLDIHASSNPNSRIFAICEPNASKIIKNLPLPIVVSGFDNVEPGGTDYYMNKIGRIGICVECGYLGDPLSTKTAEDLIVNFLVAREHCTGILKNNKQSYIRIYDLYSTKTDFFKLTKNFYDFEKIKKGYVIGIDGEEKIKAKKESVILFAHDRYKKGEEAFLLGEYLINKK